jgi:hypothetical protein
MGYLEDLIMLVAQLNHVGGCWLLHREGGLVVKWQWEGLKGLILIIPLRIAYLAIKGSIITLRLIRYIDNEGCSLWHEVFLDIMRMVALLLAVCARRLAQVSKQLDRASLARSLLNHGTISEAVHRPSPHLPRRARLSASTLGARVHD